jgi:hypothetical protein
MSAVSSNFRGGVFMSAIVEPSAQAVKPTSRLPWLGLRGRPAA